MRHGRGFTLVELLVAVAIIAVLVGLILFGLRSAWEAARRTQCLINVRQIAAGLRHFHEARGHFPAGNVAGDAGVCPSFAQHNEEFPSENGANWAISILPFLDEKQLYARYERTTYNEAPENQFVRESRVSAFICPSDPRDDELVVPALGPAASWDLNVAYRPGSYRAVSGRSDGKNFLDDGLVTTYPASWRGVMHVVGILGHRPESLETIRDGASHTLMIGEATTRTRSEFGTFWAYSFSFYSLSAVTEQRRTLSGDYQGCVDQSGYGYSLPCRRGWGSSHRGVIQFARCDGSARAISTDVDLKTLAAAATIDGGEAVRLRD